MKPIWSSNLLNCPNTLVHHRDPREQHAPSGIPQDSGSRVSQALQVKLCLNELFILTSRLRSTSWINCKGDYSFGFCHTRGIKPSLLCRELQPQCPWPVIQRRPKAWRKQARSSCWPSFKLSGLFNTGAWPHSSKAYHIAENVSGK